jgi:hypothetical protein
MSASTTLELPPRDDRAPPPLFPDYCDDFWCTMNGRCRCLPPQDQRRELPDTQGEREGGNRATS